MWPRFSRSAGVIALAAMALATGAIASAKYVAAVVLVGAFAAIAIRAMQECASSMKAVAAALRSPDVISLNPAEELRAPIPLATDLKLPPLPENGATLPWEPSDVRSWRSRGAEWASRAGPA